jgi:uncharacterized membrane protein
MTMLETVLLACALAASLVVRPWRMLLRADGGWTPLAAPLLACLFVLPWLWSWPVGEHLPVPVQWSGAGIAVLMLGWPLAVPVLAIAGLGTMLTLGAPLEDAISATVWFGMLPATGVLLLGHAVRRTFGANPLAYVLGRGYAVPLAVLFACTLACASMGGNFARPDDPDGLVGAFLMALGEAAWTGGIAALLVTWRPRWLATWPDPDWLQRRKSPRSAA